MSLRGAAGRSSSSELTRHQDNIEGRLGWRVRVHHGVVRGCFCVAYRPSDVLERVTAIIPSSAHTRNAERKQKSELPFLLIRARGTVLRVLIDCLPRRWPYALSVLFYKFGQSVSDQYDVL